MVFKVSLPGIKLLNSFVSPIDDDDDDDYHYYAVGVFR